MATTKFATLLHRRTNKITRVLVYALLEWILIFLLLLNSLFSVLIHKFACFFGLKPPCIFCSRLDHHFLKPQKSKSGNSSFSLDIICEQHAAEISRIGYCSNHRKLVECHSMCLDCSSPSAHDATLFSWMREIGIVRADGGDDDDVKKCSCCDGFIKSSSLDQITGDLVVNQRGLLDSDSDLKFGYEILDHVDVDDDEEEKKEKESDVGFKAEKEPLLNMDEHEEEEEEEEEENDTNTDNEKVVTDRNINLCPEMLPQHLEFYIDHDDYRLIPVDLVDSVKVKKGEISSYEDDSKEFDLVFEGNELLSGCMFKESLPCIKEEEEEMNKVGLEGVDVDVEEEDHHQQMGLGEGGGKIGERSLANLKEEDEEKIRISQPHEEGKKMDISQPQEENNIEEEKLEISQSHQEKGKNEERSLPNLEEREEKFEISQSHYEESKEEQRRRLPTLQEDEEKREISQPHEEEHKNVEGSLINLEEQQKEEIMEMSQPHIEEHMNVERSLSTVEEEQKEEKVEISLLEIDEDNIEERNLAILQDDEEKETKMEDNSVTSKPCLQEKREIENAAFLQVQEESPEVESTHILLKEEEDRTLEPTEIASASLDGKQTEEGDAETGNNGDIVVEISEKSLTVDVGLSQNDLEEEKVPDTPSSVESLHHLHKKLLLLSRRESATEESLDGSMISELEGGDGSATIEKLKSELHTERKALRALYKELEEERSASAIAANQTMAMINRLQEEKATMQMEALQYQRMLEEQSEYDQEALQMMNELMVKREKEKQELEKELEVLRKKVMDYEERERMRVLCRRREGSMRSRNSSASCSYGEESDGLSIDLNNDAKDHEEDGTSPRGHEENGHQDTPTEAVLGLQESLAGFEEERQAILEQLKALEEKLFTLAEEEEEHIENMKPFEQFYEENGKDFDANGDDNGFSHVNGKHHSERKSNGSMHKRLLPLFDATDLMESPDGEFEGREQGFDYLELNKSPITKFELEKKKLAIEEEVDHVYERLQALEADREFLKHCIGSLRKGDKGLDLLQEILQHLRDLKNVELQAMKNMDQCASV